MDPTDVYVLKGMKIVHVNIRSLYKKLPELSSLYANFDFIMCSETWLDRRFTDAMINIEGFTAYRCDRCEADPFLLINREIPRRGGGVIIYAKNKWTKYLRVYDQGTRVTKDFEIISVLLNKPGMKHMLLSCVYKPPTGDIDNFIIFLKILINLRPMIKREKWIIGDFNIDYLRRNANIMTSVKTFLKESGLRQLIEHCTRLTPHGATCIDWIITDCDYVESSGVLNDLLSDHFLIYVNRKKIREKVVRDWKSIRQYKKFNNDIFCDLLMEIDWNVYDNENDVNRMWDMLLYKINEILSVMCPWKRVYLCSKKSPWITPTIINYINERTKIAKIFRKTGSPHMYELSKFLRNKVTTLIRNAKSKYIQENLFMNKNNPKKFWRILRTVFIGESKSEVDMEFIHPDTNTKVDRDETPNFLNCYFINIGSHRNDPVNNSDVLEEYGPPLHVFEKVTLPEVIKLINDIDISKDSCIPGVSSHILKHAFQRIPDKIKLLFDFSIDSGIFPKQWTVGYVNLLPKSGDLSNPGNWRPITQTCIPAKLLEKLIQTRLMKVLLQNKYISDDQFGFVPGRSTQLAVMETVCDLYHAMNSNLVTGLLFLDVRKAFDSLNHKILLEKIKNLGIENSIVRWFRSYLNRTQILKFNGHTSDELRVVSGIPQGSILGPTLFIFYINGIFDTIKDVKIKMFADDCVLYKSGARWEDIHAPLQRMLDVYITWGNEHCLRLNAEKTKCMIVANNGKLKNIVAPAPFHAGNRQIMFVNRFSYLGIVIDNEMTLEPLYKHVCRQVEQKLFMLRKIRRHLTKFAAVSLYKQMILPLFDYAGFLLLSCNLGQKRELQRMQNSSIRTCLLYNRIEHITIDRLHNEMKIASLEQRRHMQCI